MHVKMQSSTDVAALGIWDRGQATEPTAGSVTTLEEHAQQIEACILRMGVDCGGAVDVFVDEDMPAELLAESVPLAEERTVRTSLRMPSPSDLAAVTGESADEMSLGRALLDGR